MRNLLTTARRQPPVSTHCNYEKSPHVEMEIQQNQNYRSK